MKISKINILLLFFIFFNTVLFGQDCIKKSDTFFLFNLQYNLKNGNPVGSSFILKDLVGTETLSVIQTQKEFLCWFYENGIIFPEPIDVIINKCKDNFKGKKNKRFKEYDKMIKGLSSYKTMKFADVKNDIQFQCIKFSGEFWFSEDESIISDQVYLKECLHPKGEYILRRINKIFQLSKLEKEDINKFSQ